MVNGDWVLIEDIDRAPRELLAALRPIIEGRPVNYAPHKPPLIPAPSFRLFGSATSNYLQSNIISDLNNPLFSPPPSSSASTTATSSNTSQLLSTNQKLRRTLRPLPTASLFGLSKLFLQVPIEPLDPCQSEISAVAASLHPSLPLTILPPLLKSFDYIAYLASGGTNLPTSSSSSSSNSQPMESLRVTTSSSRRSGTVRIPTIRDVLKVCCRMDSLFSSASSSTSTTITSSYSDQERKLSSFASVSSMKVRSDGVLTEAIKSRLVAEIVDIAVVGSADDSFVESSSVALGSVWQLLPQSIVQLCTKHLPSFHVEGGGDGGQVDNNTAAVVMGRVRLPLNPLKSNSSAMLSGGGGLPQSQHTQTFAHTGAALRLMERVSACILNSEPVLLVGETGGGKTSLIQELAVACGHELLVQNLSLQTDATDLLGGFKPMDIRALARYADISVEMILYIHVYFL
jgi:hypothetical protein